MGPEKFLVSTEALIFPDWPGLMVLSKEATVHPQEGRASGMIRSCVPSFFTVKTVSIFSPLATVPTSLFRGSMAILAVETGLASPVAFFGSVLPDAGLASGAAGFFSWAVLCSPAKRFPARAAADRIRES